MFGSKTFKFKESKRPLRASYKSKAEPTKQTQDPPLRLSYAKPLPVVVAVLGTRCRAVGETKRVFRIHVAVHTAQRISQFTLSKASDESKPTTSRHSRRFARVTTLAVNRCSLILWAGRCFIEGLIQHVGLRRPWRETLDHGEKLWRKSS